MLKMVISEFYHVNLMKGISDVEHGDYGKVIVRGHLFDLTPVVINNFLAKHA